MEILDDLSQQQAAKTNTFSHSLHVAAKWAKFIGVANWLFAVLLFVFVIYSYVSFIQSMNQSRIMFGDDSIYANLRKTMMISTIFSVISSFLMFICGVFTFRFGRRMIQGHDQADDLTVLSAFVSLRKHFLYSFLIIVFAIINNLITYIL